MVSIEMVGQGGADNWPQDGGGPGGQLHATEVFNILLALNGYGVDGYTLTMTVTDANRLVTIPAFEASVPDGSGNATKITYAGGNATITAAHATLPRVDIVTLDTNGTLAVTAGTATAETGDVQEAPMPALAADEILLAKVKVPAAQTNVLSDDVFGRSINVSNSLQGGVPVHQLIGPGPVAMTAYDYQRLVPIWKDTTGVITHAAMLVVLSASTVAVVEYRLEGNDWVHDGVLGRDAEVTLNFTATTLGQINGFGIDSPGTSSNRILFVAGNNSAGTDTFEVDSIDLNDGEGLTATAVTISGANQPTDTNNMATVSCAATVTSLLTIFEDDGHTAVISGTEGGFTFTYTAAKVAAIDTSIDVNGTPGNVVEESLYVIGTQVLLFRGNSSGTIADCSMWEMSTAFVLTTEFLDASVGFGTGTLVQQPSQLFPIGGKFALSTPVMPMAGYVTRASRIISTFPLDNLVGNS
jgi:hypothetical protein